MPFLLLLLLASVCLADALDIRILRVEFLYEEPDNSLTTGRGLFTDSRDSEAYWQSHIKFAENYFDKASGGKVSISAEVFPKKQKAYKLQKYIIDYNRTNRYKGEKMEAFDSSKAADYARFVNDVLALAKEDEDGPLEPLPNSLRKRVILIAHAGANRLVDGGTMGIRGANTPGDFMDAYIDTTWGEFWRGFEVSEGDTIRAVMVSSETASQDGLNWGIAGTITSQIGREFGLPYSFDVVKGFSRLGYFDGMDFAGYNAGNGFFPVFPGAWMRAYKDWAGTVKEISPGKERISVDICAAGYICSGAPQIVKIPINRYEYILLENRQRTDRADGKISVKMSNGQQAEIPVDSLSSLFSATAAQRYPGVIESIEQIDAALPASGIAAWHVNDWYVRELLPYGAVNAWNGENYRDHQFGIALIEPSGILALGKEFKNSSGESVFYFGSGSDLLPHKRFSGQKQLDTVFSIKPQGYGNTASTFGGISGLKITAKVPPGAKQEKTYNAFTGDSVINWRALKIPVEIEWVGKYVRPVSVEKLPAKDEFPECKESPKPYYLNKSYNLGKEIFCPIYEEINRETMFLGNNRLYIVDSNGIPLPKFPAILSNGEPLENFRSKPLAIDIDGDGSREILIPANNGLILAVNSEGKLLKEEFPIAAGTFVYEDTIPPPMRLLLRQSGDSVYLFALHRESIKAFYLPEAKEFKGKETVPNYRDEISEFFIYPNPIRAGKAAMRFRLESYAASATLEIFDITGFKVFSRNVSSVNYGSNQIEGLDFSNLGSDIYSARLSVKFASGVKKEKWVRVGVAR